MHIHPTPSRLPEGYDEDKQETFRKDWAVTEQDKQLMDLLTSRRDLFERRAAKIKEALEDGNAVSSSSSCWGREGKREVCLVCRSISLEYGAVTPYLCFLLFPNHRQVLTWISKN